LTSKAKNQVWHAKKRAKQRFGLSLNRHSYGEMVKMIQSGKATFVSSSSSRVKIFSVPYDGNNYKVIYDNKRKKIVTFLPEDPNVQVLRQEQVAPVERTQAHYDI
jgi:hypothetical protein